MDVKCKAMWQESNEEEELWSGLRGGRSGQ